MSSDEDRPLKASIAKALDNPWIVLGLVFFVFAVFGIPLIWISKAFPAWVKVLLTIIVTLYTGLILWLFWLTMVWSYNRVVNSF